MTVKEKVEYLQKALGVSKTTLASILFVPAHVMKRWEKKEDAKTIRLHTLFRAVQQLQRYLVLPANKFYYIVMCIEPKSLDYYSIMDIILDRPDLNNLDYVIKEVVKEVKLVLNYTNNEWKRRGFYYYCNAHVLRADGSVHSSTVRRLSFISYHLTKLIHGEDRLREMAANEIIYETNGAA